MPVYGWKPEYQIPPPKKKVWGPPPDISPHRHLKRAQLTKNKIPPQRRDPTEDELQILYEREIYRLFNLHASKEELQKQYKQFQNEKVYPGIIHAWLKNSYQGDADRLGMPDGQGSACLGRGVCYKGTFKQGLLHGQGHLQWGKGKGCSYEGDFYFNRILGKGVYSWAGGAKYSGELFDGIPHGSGTMEKNGGLKYEGCWEIGKRQGKGKMTFGNIAVYDGNWNNDLQDGEGNLVFTTGSSYHGTWLEGKRHGQGQTQVQRITPSKQRVGKVAAYSHTLASKGKPDSIYAHTYTGDWIGGLPHGRGRSEWTWDNKKKDSSVLMNSYVGSYENGMRHGQGSFFYASGALFQGHWRGNKKVGLGILVYETGKLHFGVFSHDHYDPISNPGLDIKEPLESALQLASEDIQTSKYGVWRAIMCHKNVIQAVFISYCSIVKETPNLTTPPQEEGKKLDENKRSKEIEKFTKKDTKSEQSKSPPKNKTSKQDSPQASLKKNKKDSKDKDGKDETTKSKPKELPKEGTDADPTKEVATIVQLDRPQSPRAVQGWSRGMSNEQFWRLLHDGHMLCPGLGYGQVDRMLPQNDLSWDPISEIHTYTRQLVLREIVSAFIQIGLARYQHEDICSEEKVEKFLASHLPLLKLVDNNSLFAKVELVQVQGVLNTNRPALDRLFCELLLESETPDYTIKLKSLFQFGQARRPEIDVPSGALLLRIALEVYSIDMLLEDGSKLLDQDINYKEYEIIILLFATMGKDLPKTPDADIGNDNLKDKTKKTTPDGKQSPTPQEKTLTTSQPKKDLKGNYEKTLPKSPTSPKSPKTQKDDSSKLKGKETNEKNSQKLVEVDIKDAKAKANEAREKAKAEYEAAVANLLNKFIVDEVAVYKAPKVVKGTDSKNVKGKTQKPPAKN
ncbi:unnamed protein product [Calypogeia fissa]